MWKKETSAKETEEVNVMDKANSLSYNMKQLRTRGYPAKAAVAVTLVASRYKKEASKNAT